MTLIEKVNLSPEAINRKAREMSHWVQIARDLYDSKDETYVLTMLKVELETQRRMYIVNRIYAHYNALRRRRELDEINHYTAGTRKRKKDRTVPLTEREDEEGPVFENAAN